MLQLIRRPNEANQIQRFSEKKFGRANTKYNRPFWLSASNYYILTFAVTIAFFFLIWGILNEGDEDAPWILAGVAASIILGGAVFLREIILRKARNQFLLVQKQMDSNLKHLSYPVTTQNREGKLSLEKNAEIIKEIKNKSEAAKVLKKLPDAHLEVFEICNEYLQINKKALETVGAGSPRLAALRRGREIVKQIHKYHLFTWAGIESRLLTNEAKNQVKISDKLKSAQNAQTVLESALRFYPDEKQLIESEEVVKEYIASIKISHWIEQAERAVFKENYKRAVNCYRDALFFLVRENIQNEERKLIAEKINQEIEKIQQIENQPKNIKNIS